MKVLDRIKGQAWCFGDNMNTDVIHSPRFFSLDPEVIKKGLFHGLDPNIQPNMQPMDLIVGGINFGCGSSRETSVRSLCLNQVGAIIAVDFARIFFRNCTNMGLPCLMFKNPKDLSRITTGMALQVDALAGRILLPDQTEIQCKPVNDFIRNIWMKGGLLATLPQSNK